MGILASFRKARVCSGRVWYLSYFEQGRRRQPRVGRDREAAKQLAAETNAQLEAGIPSTLGNAGSTTDNDRPPGRMANGVEVGRRMPFSSAVPRGQRLRQRLARLTLRYMFSCP